MTSRLVLASASPRRAAILDALGLAFEVAPVDADESPPADAAPEDAVVAIAQRKAEAATAPEGAWVLAADTVGVIDGRLVGKPRDDADAIAMLLALSGRTHRVLTGLAVRDPTGRIVTDRAETAVTFATVTRAQAEAYVATGEPRGKAGAYAIQGKGAALVTGIRGEYANVVGLPARATVTLLARAGFPLPAWLAPDAAVS